MPLVWNWLPFAIALWLRNPTRQPQADGANDVEAAMGTPGSQAQMHDEPTPFKTELKLLFGTAGLAYAALYTILPRRLAGDVVSSNILARLLYTSLGATVVCAVMAIVLIMYVRSHASENPYFFAVIKAMLLITLAVVVTSVILCMTLLIQ